MKLGTIQATVSAMAILVVLASTCHASEMTPATRTEVEPDSELSLVGNAGEAEGDSAAHDEIRIGSTGTSVPAVEPRDGGTPEWVAQPLLAAIRIESGESLDVGDLWGISMAQGHFDRDGIADLAVGYSSWAGHFVALHRGNADAIFPYTREAQLRRAAGTFSSHPFLPDARAYAVPSRPEMLATGDFDNDGRRDVVVATRGEFRLHLLPGDGQGGLLSAVSHPLPGAIQKLVTGEVNRRDAVIDLVVAIEGDDGPALLVFEGPDGALRADPERFELPWPATDLALGRVTGDHARDIVVATGEQLWIVHGRDRRLTSPRARRERVGDARIERHVLDGAPRAITVGDFVRQPAARQEVGVLLANGDLVVLGDDANGEAGRLRPLAIHASAANSTDGVRVQESLLVPVRAGGLTEHIVLVDRASSEMKLLTAAIPGQRSSSDSGLAAEFTSAAQFALPMRLNVDALSDLVALRPDGGIEVALSSVAATIVVNSSLDNQVAADGACTLREAIGNANSDSDNTGGDCAAGVGADAIHFQIAGGGGTASIALSLALPTVEGNVSIDGTTQGCGSGPCVEIDGSATAAVDAIGLTGGNVTIRGLAIHGFDVSAILALTSGNFIEGNHLGLDLTGDTPVGNLDDGVHITDGTGNTIGGTALPARNIVSGNRSGVQLQGAGATDNVIQGNLMGTDKTGTLPRPNEFEAVLIGTSASSNTVGGTLPGAGNLLSGNTASSVAIVTGATDNLVLGNRSGTDISGTFPVANQQYGVLILGTQGNTIGSTATGGGNLISGNGIDGVLFFDNASDNLIQGNWIGVKVGGDAALANGNDGIEIDDSSDCVIGGITVSSQNLISGNTQTGVRLEGATTSGVKVIGNFIGTDKSGTLAVGNVRDGVYIRAGAHDNSIGEADSGARNVISGNLEDGITVAGAGTDNNEIQGNYVGLDASGSFAIPNLAWGVQVTENVVGTTIGGTAPGAGNVISGNAEQGAAVELNSSSNTLQGNRIGTDATGTFAIPNGFNGIFIGSAAGNIVGGTEVGAGNLISGNAQNGVAIAHVGTEDNIVQGNLIGTDLTGTQSVANLFHGVLVFNTSRNTIGGTSPGARNVIAGGDRNGISIKAEAGMTAEENVVQGNRIGTDISGTLPIGFAQSGVLLTSAENNLIGGAVPGAGNLIADSGLDGVRFESRATGNVISGNRIGTDISGTLPLGNAANGVRISGGSRGNTIGGEAPGEGNLIAGNAEIGISVIDSSALNSILGNSLVDNGLLGIDLAANGVTPNDFMDNDFGANTLQNFPEMASATATPVDVTITGNLHTRANQTFRVEFFAGPDCDGSGHGEGERFVGSTTVATDAGGDGAINVVLSAAVGAGEAVTATATDASGNSSELSACVAASCTSTVPFPQTLSAQDPSRLFWAAPADVRFVKGDLADVSSYATLTDAPEPAATGIDISLDEPAIGGGLYYIVRPLGCGSWQTELGAQPERDATLP